MAHSVKHYASLDMAEVIFSGEMTADDLRQSTSKAIMLQRMTGVVRFVVNIGDVEAAGLKPDMSDVLDSQYRSEGLSRTTRIAVLLPRTAATRKLASLYEIGCQERGWNAQICADRNAAVEWLMNAERKQPA
jgi:hypothetical protein